MKLTLENLENLRTKRESIRNEVIDYIVDKWEYYDDKKEIFTDVIYQGCESGIVENLIYFDDTISFYKKYNTQINIMLYTVIESTGFRVDQIFKNWDIIDPLALCRHNQNILAWFGFEEMMKRTAEQFEELADLI